MTYTREPIRDKWGKTYEDILDELLKERGVSEYAAFGAHDQGLELPSGLLTWWCLVLSQDGILWGYFLDWDPDKGNPDGEKGYYKLREPRERSTKYFEEDLDYIRARTKLGLPLTEKQQHIVQEWGKEGNR